MNTSSVEKKFVYLAIIFGMIIMVLTPPFQAPDENNHFKKAYVISKGNMFPEEQEGKAGFYLPEKMVQYIEEQNSKAGNLEEKYEFKDIYMMERLPAGYDNMKFYNFSTASQNPLGHCVQAMGIIIGQAFAHILAVDDPSVVYQLYFARFFNLLFYVAVIAISIRLTPILKKTFATIALMPMALFQAATVSYDPVLIALAFLATSLIFNIAFNEEVRQMELKHLILLGGIAYVFYAVKIVYLPLLFLLLIVPKEKWGDKKEILKKLGVIVMTFVIIFLIFIVLTPRLELIKDNSSVLAHEQMLYVIRHPINYLITFFYTLIHTRQFLIATTIGTFGLIDTNLYCVFLGAYLFILTLIGISEISLNDRRINLRKRLVIFVSVSAPIFGCFLAMYIYWTSTGEGFGVGASEITGVQGRYFIPVMPAIFLFFTNQILQRNDKIKKRMKLLVDNSELVVIVMLCMSAIALLLRFWC